MSSSLQSRSTEEEILRTLKSINQTAAETDQVSAATAEVIVAQGDQIDNIARNADKIEKNLNTSEWLIKGLKGWGGRIANLISGPAATEGVTVKYPTYLPRDALQGTHSVPNRSEGSLLQPTSEFDLEVDKQLDSISNALGNIHARSLELSNSIARQVHVVEAVDRSIEKSNDRIKRQHQDIKRLR